MKCLSIEYQVIIIIFYKFEIELEKLIEKIQFKILFSWCPAHGISNGGDKYGYKNCCFFRNKCGVRE